MKIETKSFGTLEIEEDQFIHFPHGLPGFPEEKKFALLPHQPDSAFAFLQSATEPYLFFIIIEPFSFFKEYTFTIEDNIMAELALTDDNPPGIFNIVRIPDNPEEMTVNLQAPILINWQTRQAMQIILEKSSYTVRHRLFPEGLAAQMSKGGK